MQRKSGFPVSFRRQPTAASQWFWPPVLFGMVVLLIILAVLQYRWTAEVSGANERQVGSALRSVMIDWDLDLFREFSAVCVALQVGPDSGAHDSWNDYLARYMNWSRGERNNSLVNLYRNPDLVEGIYIWETSSEAPRLLRFNEQRGSIDLSTTRPDLAALLDRLRENSANLSMGLHAWESRKLRSNERLRTDQGSNGETSRTIITTGWQFDQSIPAIVHPIVRNEDNTPVDWIVVVLNRGTIQGKVLPALARRHFSGPNGLGFDVALVSTGSSSRIIYSSEPGFGLEAPDAYDSVMDLFGPPPESIEAPFLRNGQRGDPSEREQWHSFSSAIWFPTIEYDWPKTSWMLVVRSRQGPLQEFVAKARRRNLAISALVLLLLAINMGVATVLGLRAQRVADLQMNFVASVSHEFRTPLSVLFSAAQNIKDGLVRKNESLVSYGSLMMSQTRQLMYLVDRILLFASIRSGKARYNLGALEIGEIIQRVVNATAELVKENECTLVHSMEPDLPPVWGDLYAVCSCLENLVTNAIKYSDKDREISIDAAHHRTDDGREEVWISVRDRGIGISGSELARIFQPFYRSPVAAASRIHGTGLGLFVAKHVAEAMGGRLSVTSEVGVGSVFTIQLRAWEPGDDTMRSQTDEVMVDA